MPPDSNEPIPPPTATAPPRDGWSGPLLDLQVPAQPDDESCGPTCLHAVYQYFGMDSSLDVLRQELATLPAGGTLAVLLGCHALRRGMHAAIYTYNVQVFDPTWFKGERDLAERLAAQRSAKHGDPKQTLAMDAYLEFLALGGRVRDEEPTEEFFRSFFDRGVPLLAGLSATYLYGSSREWHGKPDDVRGEPVGHFVLVHGCDPSRKLLAVTDPLSDIAFPSRHYDVDAGRLLRAVMLGVVTYDGCFLALSPNPLE